MAGAESAGHEKLKRTVTASMPAQGAAPLGQSVPRTSTSLRRSGSSNAPMEPAGPEEATVGSASRHSAMHWRIAEDFVGIASAHEPDPFGWLNQACCMRATLVLPIVKLGLMHALHLSPTSLSNASRKPLTRSASVTASESSCAMMLRASGQPVLQLATTANMNGFPRYSPSPWKPHLQSHRKRAILEEWMKNGAAPVHACMSEDRQTALTTPCKRFHCLPCLPILRGPEAARI